MHNVIEDCEGRIIRGFVAGSIEILFTMVRLKAKSNFVRRFLRVLNWI